MTLIPAHIAAYQNNGLVVDNDEDGSESAKNVSSQSKETIGSKAAKKHLKSGTKGKSSRGIDTAKGKTNLFATQGLSFSEVLRGAGGDNGNVFNCFLRTSVFCFYRLSLKFL